MEGTLKKLGQKGLIKIWRQRYFKEDPETGKIFYYKSKNDKIPQGFINISEITGVKPRDDNFGFLDAYGFEIQTPNRTYQLLASTETEQLNWINGLLKRIKQNKVIVPCEGDWKNIMKLASRSCLIKISNETPKTLIRKNFKLHGVFQIWRMLPPEKIHPNSAVEFGTESSALFSGTSASVLYTIENEPALGELCFRWDNPYRKLTAFKQALAEATGPFIIETITDKSESYRLFHLAADRFKITYKIIVDENRMKNWTSPNRKTQLLETDNVEGFVLLEQPVKETQTSQIVKRERYHEDWIAKLKKARKSVLVTLENKTSRILERMESSVRHGLWRQLPPEKVNAFSEVMFGNESTGLAGAEGKVLYLTFVPNSSSESTVITLLWRNTIFGCDFDYQITTNAVTEKLFVKVIEVKKEAAAEVVFQITDTDPETEKSTSKDENSPNVESTTSSSNISEKKETLKSKVKKGIKTFQEEGIIHKLTPEFRITRERLFGERKEKIAQFLSRYEMVSHEIIQHYKNANPVSSFFSSLLGKDKIETTVDMIDPNTTFACYVCKKSFDKSKEKTNCQLCGQVIHSNDKNCSTLLPFPSKFDEDLRTVKIKPGGIVACTHCASYLQDATAVEKWATTRREAAKNPLIPLQQNICTTCKMISGQLTLYRAEYTPESENSPLAKEIQSLLEQLEIQLAELKSYVMNFGMLENDHRTPTEKKLQEALVQAVTQFRTNVLNTLQEIKE